MPASAPDVVVWAVSSLGGQIVRTAKSDNTSGRNLIESPRRLDQANPDISRVDDTPNSRGFGTLEQKLVSPTARLGQSVKSGFRRELSGEVAKSCWLRIQSVNDVFALTLVA